MPDLNRLLDEGIRHARAGAHEQALDCFTMVARASDSAEKRVLALKEQAAVHRKRCEWDAALEAARSAGQQAKNSGLRHLFAEALNAEALVHQSRGRFATARGIYLEILGIADDDRMRGIAFQNLGSLAAAESDHALAERYFTDSAQCFERAGYLRGSAIALTNSAAAALDRKEPERARMAAEAALSMARRLDELELAGIAGINLAEALVALGEHEAAEAAASDALGYFVSTENTWRSVQCLRLIGDAFAARGNTETARRAYDRGLQFARTIDAALEERQLTDRLARI